MSSETKSVTISGAAAESYLTGNKTRRKRKQKGGQQVPSEAQEVIPAESDRMVRVNRENNTPKNVFAIVTKETSTPSVQTPAPTPIPTASVQAAAPANVTQLLGGNKEQEKEKKKIPVKVILEKTKKAKEKVVLAPAKPKVTKETPGVLVAKKPKNKTLKAARRIRVSLDGLSKRIHRAKTIKKDSEKISLEDIKKKLQQAGLIKKDSKAPESMLRQMYIDFEQLKQRAL